MVEVLEYLTADSKRPFAEWVKRLDPIAAVKVFTARIRLEQGNFSSAKGVGGGVFEYRIDFGPGYRLYFGKDGDTVVILLIGGSKKRIRTSFWRTAIGRTTKTGRRRSRKQNRNGQNDREVLCHSPAILN